MPRVSLDIDSEDFDKLGRLSRRQNLSVEDFVLRSALSVVASVDGASANPSHKSQAAEAARPETDYESRRDMIHDRRRGRAEAYLSARERLLALVDNAQGDLGPEGWNRARLYEP